MVGKSVPFDANEYPELSGLESGAKVKLRGEATVKMNEDGSGELMIDSMEMETQGAATRELKQMTKQDNQPNANANAPDDF